MSSKIITMPLAELVEDMDLYPRHAVDPVHIQGLALALESGITLPPIVADRKSKRITDGWHRGRAYKRVLGPTANVDVELVSYKDDAAMIFDAAARNAHHGRRLDSIDRTRCVVMLRNAGFSNAKIGSALCVPEERVVKLAVKIAKGPAGSAGNVPGTKTIALKRSVAHLEGQTLSASQVKAHSTMPGTSFLLIARQLMLGLKEELIDLDDEKLVGALRELRDTLRKSL